MMPTRPGGIRKRGVRRTPAPLRRRRPSPLRRLLTVIAAVAAAAMIVALSTQYARTYTLARQAAQLEQHRTALAAENDTLREEIQRLETDDRYIERIARQQLGLVRSGEIELLIVPAGGTAPHAGSSADAAHPAPAPGPLRTAAAPPDPGAAVPAAYAPTWRERISAIMKHMFGWLHR